MDASDRQREQAAAGLEQLAFLARAQAWRGDGAPALPPTQAAVLRMLVGAGTELRAGRIAERLGISPASLSDSLKLLEERGWILRRSDPADGRAVLFRLGRQGRAVVARLTDPSRGLAGLMQGLPDGDVAALLRISQLLVAQAQRQGLATGLRTCIGCRFFRPYASGDAARPHLCGYTGQPFGDLELRNDCSEHEPADAGTAAATHARFRDRAPAAPKPR